MKKIWNEKQVYEMVLGAAYPDPPSTQARYREQVKKVISHTTGCTVSCSFEPEGILLQAEEETWHMLHYPFKEYFFFTTLNLLEQKARINLQPMEDEVYVDEKILGEPTTPYEDEVERLIQAELDADLQDRPGSVV